MKKYLLAAVLFVLFTDCSAQMTLYVSAGGKDTNAGTVEKPLRSLDAALDKAFKNAGNDVVIALRGGTYRLNKTLEITAAKYTLRSLVIRPYNNEKVVISGAGKYELSWKPYKNGIFKASVGLGEEPDQLWVNGKAMHMARYPNYDSSARVYNGTAADAFSKERTKNWKHPEGGYLHALHSGEWGSFDYLITGKKKDGTLEYIGGWQNNRPAPMNKQYRFVENIFEELDAPGEWYYNAKQQLLYLYPLPGVDIRHALVEIGQITDLIHITGNPNEPVRNITIRDIEFTGTNRSFMLTKEPLLRSDWTIYRGGAILLDRTASVHISHCIFHELGGNAIFLSDYNKNDTLRNNHIFDIGASAIAFVGNPEAVRSPAFRYERFVPWNEMDYRPGPRTNDYPQSCSAEGNLIHNIGTIEKQVAGVEISMSSQITVSHNTIYHTPRAGINIGDGCWGGHLLEFNDVFNTVLETGDHGAFNSWGRDRYWRPDRSVIDSIVGTRPGIENLDVTEPVTIRNNRFQCDHGWDIDLDDGSSNYHIYNNVCLNGGLKLREGYHRLVENNILINNTFHPHVWLKNSGDRFVHNIVTTAYAPILMEHWGQTIDSNFFLTKDGLDRAQALGLDAHSVWGDGGFVDPAAGNWSLRPDAPPLKTGFHSFDMDFGVTLPAWKELAAKPPVTPLLPAIAFKKGATVEWLGARVKNIETPGERSAAGLPNDNGVMITEVSPKSLAGKNHLRQGDVITALGKEEIHSVSDLLKSFQSMKWMTGVECTLLRNQQVEKLNLNLKL